MPATVKSFKLMIVSKYRYILLIVGFICCALVSDAFLIRASVSRSCRFSSHSTGEIINKVQRQRDLTIFSIDDDSETEAESIPITDSEILKDFLDISDITESIKDDTINDESSTEVEESNDLPAQRQLVWNAAVKSSVRVKEHVRTVEEYMRLPASECESAAHDIRHCHGPMALKMRQRMLILLISKGHSNYHH